MKYEEPRELSREEAERIFSTGMPHEIQGALVALALHDPDWPWVQEKCVALTAHADPGVRAISATCLGHLARIHGRLDLEVVMPRLEALRKDPQTAGYAETAIDDVAMFVRSSVGEPRR